MKVNKENKGDLNPNKTVSRVVKYPRLKPPLSAPLKTLSRDKTPFLCSLYCCHQGESSGLYVHVGNESKGFKFDEVLHLMAFL